MAGRNIRATCIVLAALALPPAAASADGRPGRLASAGPAGGNGPYSVAASFAHASRDGSRIFFVTPEALVAADQDQAQDVYETTGNAVKLVSTGPQGGNGPFPATPAGSSFDGTRAFFRTQEALTADDTDRDQDIYERTGERAHRRLHHARHPHP